MSRGWVTWCLWAALLVAGPRGSAANAGSLDQAEVSSLPKGIVAVLPPSETPTVLELSLVGTIQALLGQSAEFKKIDLEAAGPVFESKKLRRSIAIFPGVQTMGHQWKVSAYFVDVETGEILSLGLWVEPKRSLQEISREVMGKLAGLVNAPKAQAHPDSPLISVSGFDGELSDKIYAEYLGQILVVNWLAERPQNLRIVDREHIGQLLKFQQLSGLRGGQLFNIHMMVKGELSRLGDISFVVARLIDIKTASVRDKAEREFSSLENDLPETAKYLGEKLSPSLGGNPKKGSEDE